MKNLKKVLSLVLVIAMAFSLVTIASAAKLDDYSDAASITEKEAVDVLSQAGVLQGAGGAFDPTGYFTREQAAKVITYLMLGSKVADNLRTTKSSFSDVAPTRWSAPYIEYCVSTGVINGLGDGTFNPEGKVTGTQFAKMLLTALGYGKNGEYVGPNWEINTLKDAGTLEILDLNVDFTAPATREQVARYALNALLLTAQVWDKNKGEYVDSQSTGAVEFFARKLNLRCDPDVVGGVSGYTWYLNGNMIGFYADEKLIASDATGLSISQMTDKYGTWAMFYKADLDKNQGVNFYYNGAPIQVYNASSDNGRTFAAGELFVYNNLVYKVLASATGAAIIADIPNIATNSATLVKEFALRGAVINFVNTDKDNMAETVSIIVKSVAVAEGAPTVSFGTVKIPGLPNPLAPNPGTFHETKVKYPADIQADDYLLYYTDAETQITYVEKAQIVTGVATSSSSTYGVYSYNISGTARKSSELPGSLDGDDNGAVWTEMQSLFNVELEIVIDNGGNIIDVWAAENAASVSNYAVVIDTASASANFSTGVEAVLLFTDGKTKVVTLNKVGSVDATLSNATALEDQFVTYTVTSDGKYNIKDATAAYHVSGPVDIDPRSSFMTGYVGDSETIFLVKDTKPGAGTYDYVALKGVANAPDTTNATATGIEVVKFTANGVAKFVYIKTTGPVTQPTIENVAYIIYDGLFVNYTIWPATDTMPELYEYKAIVNGEATTIKSSVLFFDFLASPPVAEVGLVSVTYDKDDGYVDSYSTTVTGKFMHTGTQKASNGIIRFGTAGTGYTGYTYDNNTKVFYIDVYGNVTKKTVADINRDSDDIVTVHLTQNPYDAADLIEAIYIYVK